MTIKDDIKAINKDIKKAKNFNGKSNVLSIG